MYKKFFLIIIATFVFLGYANFATAQGFTYSDSIDHCSFDLPDRWKEIPKSVIDQFVDEVVGQTGGQRIEYDSGFQLSDKEYFQYPYILVQKHKFKFGTPSYIEIEKMFDMGNLDQITTDKIKEYSELIRNARFDQPFVDKEHNIIFINIQADVANIGVVNGLMTMFLGKEGIIQFGFYSVESEYLNYLPVFSSIIDSFSYNIGYEYDEIEAKKNNPKGIFEGGAEKAFIGGITGLIFGLIFFFFERKKKRKLIIKT